MTVPCFSTERSHRADDCLRTGPPGPVRHLEHRCGDAIAAEGVSELARTRTITWLDILGCRDALSGIGMPDARYLDPGSWIPGTGILLFPAVSRLFRLPVDARG